MKKSKKPDDCKPDPLAEAAGDFVSKLCAAFDDYDRNTSKILRDYIDTNRR